MAWQEHIYRVAIHREIQIARLAFIDDAELEAADEAGFLAGNAMFQDLSACTWEDAAAAAAAEARLIDRLRTASDDEAEADLIEDERAIAFEDEDSLWNLDVGVIGAVTTLAAMGCVPIASCNAGGFGGQHQAHHPYVSFYLPAPLVGDILAVAELAEVGVILDDDGVAQLYSDRDLGLAQFAKLALERHD